jgi:hypothetical protein
MRTLKSIRILAVVLSAGLASSAPALEIGPDDRQVSFTGAPGSVESDAVTPAVAHDTQNQRYLLVWSADDTDGEFRIMGRLLTGFAGEPIGPAFPIADAPAGADQRQPAVAFSPDHEHYLVVWSGDELNPGATEIMGQRVGTDGALLGDPARYSDMGSNDVDPAFDAVTPDLAWHADLGAFTLVWAADDDAGLLQDGRFEVYGQLVEGGSGNEIGANDFRITFSLADDRKNDVLEPAVAVLPGTDRWVVVFEGDVADDEVHDPEIFGYGCNADVPDPAGFIVSQMGSSVFDGLSARRPDVAYVPGTGEFVCVWDGQDGTPQSPGIFGQRFLPDGTPVGAAIDMTAGLQRHALRPSIVIDPATGDWFVSWAGTLAGGSTGFVGQEIWLTVWDPTGTALLAGPDKLSAMNPMFGNVSRAGAPAVAINPVHGTLLAAWSGDRDVTPDGEHEIFTQGWSRNAPSAAEETIPSAFRLLGAAPNPFNPSTTIAFDLPRAQPVTLRVYDAAGRLVRTLIAGERGTPGRNEVRWDGADEGGRAVASGVYLYRLETPSHADQGRMLLVK